MMHSPSELYWVSWMVPELDSGTTSSLERWYSREAQGATEGTCVLSHTSSSSTT